MFSVPFLYNPICRLIPYLLPSHLSHQIGSCPLWSSCSPASSYPPISMCLNSTFLSSSLNASISTNPLRFLTAELSVFLSALNPHCLRLIGRVICVLLDSELLRTPATTLPPNNVPGELDWSCHHYRNDLSLRPRCSLAHMGPRC